MLSWLKRLPELVLFAIRVSFIYVIAGATVLTAFAVALLKLDVVWWKSLAIGLSSVPAVLLIAVILWFVFKWCSRVFRRVAGFLWKYRAFRYALWAFSLVAALWIAWRSIAVMGTDAWVLLICEAIGIAALAMALFLSKGTTRLESRMRMRFGPQWPARFGMLRVAAWLFGIVLIDLWLYATVEGLLGGNWVVLPWGLFGHPRVPLAALPPLVFTCAALLARPPYLRRSAPRWVFVFKKVKEEELYRAKRLFRINPSRIFGRERKFVKVTEADGRTGEAGERFVLGRMLWTGVAFVTIVSIMGLSVFADWFLPSVPSDLSSVKAYQPVVSTAVYDRNGRLMCSFSLENRVYAPLGEIPQHVQDAFVAAEDKNFWQHEGIDPQGILRAGIANFRNGEARQGASTITQQAIKQIVLKDPSRNWRRKASEIILAVRFEKQMAEIHGGLNAKREILEIYLNHVYLGKNAYGIQAAAETYFGKSAKNLTLAEAAILAGLPKAPSLDSPDGHFERAKLRQRYVLGRMVETGAITLKERDEALSAPLTIIKRAHPFNMATAPYACEETRKFAERKFGYAAVYKQGLVIMTTFDLELQRKAQASVRYGLLDLERRLGFAGPEGHDKSANARCDGPTGWVADEAIEANARVFSRDHSSIMLCVRGNAFRLDADDVKRVGQWEKAKPGRVLRAGDLMTVRIETRTDAKGNAERFALAARRTGGKDHPEALQAALLAVDPRSGEIRAIVGGYDWNENQYNNATQARRQTGSSIKPYVYLTALANGKTVASTEVDAPVCLSTASGPWCPTNYSGPHTTRVYYGTVDLATALAKSLNSVSVRLAMETGLDKIIGTMRALGIRSPIVRVFPLAVGTPELTLWEHTVGYATILSNGRAMAVQGDGYSPGIFVKEVRTFIRGPNGRTALHTIYKSPDRPIAQAVPSGDAYAMTHLMRGVVQSGTGTRAKRLRRPVAGKTGTTNNFRDVWFMGGTADLAVGAWVGRRTPAPISTDRNKEATGGSVALPIWEAFMESAFPVPEEGKAFATPPRDFPIPDDVTLVRRSETEDGQTPYLPFQRGRMPESYLQAPAADFGRGAFD